MPRPETPERGDLVWMDFSPHAGHEQAGRRPAVILSSADYNQLVGLAIVCPITSRVKGYSFEVAIPPGLAISGVILADQVKSLDWKSRKAERIATLPEAVVSEVLVKLRSLL